MRIADSLGDGLPAPADDGLHELLELGTGDGLHQVLGAGCVGCDEGQVDLCLHGGGQFDLRLLTCLSDPPEGHVVRCEIDSGLLLELSDDVVGQSLIHIGSSQLGVSGCGQDFEDSVAEVHDCDIQGSSSEVEDHDLLLYIGLVKTVCECRCGRLVDDTYYIQSCDRSGILGCLPLVVVEVSGYCDDRLVDGLSEVRLRVLLDLLEDEC